MDGKRSLYLHGGNSSCRGCPDRNSTERAPGDLVNCDILSSATCKQKMWKHLHFKPNYLPFVRTGNHWYRDIPQTVFMYQSLTNNIH